MRIATQPPVASLSPIGRAAVTHGQIVTAAEHRTERAYRGVSATQAVNRFTGRGSSRGREIREVVVTRPSPDFVKMGMLSYLFFQL